MGPRRPGNVVVIVTALAIDGSIRDHLRTARHEARTTCIRRRLISLTRRARPDKRVPGRRRPTIADTLAYWLENPTGTR